MAHISRQTSTGSLKTIKNNRSLQERLTIATYRQVRRRRAAARHLSGWRTLQTLKRGCQEGRAGEAMDPSPPSPGLQDRLDRGTIVTTAAETQPTKRCRRRAPPRA